MDRHSASIEYELGLGEFAKTILPHHSSIQSTLSIRRLKGPKEGASYKQRLLIKSMPEKCIYLALKKSLIDAWTLDFIR